MRMRACAAAVLAAGVLHAAPDGVRVVLAGDSTVTDAAGWGTGFRNALGESADVVNLAHSGASSKSYRDAGDWAKVLAAKADWVLIQFGHNDVPGKGPARETDAGSTFRANLAAFVKEARTAGMKPVLVTSVVHRKFDAGGAFAPDKTLGPYAEAVRAVAAAEHVPLIDLFALTAAQCAQLGQAGCEAMGRTTKNKDGAETLDRTHYGPEGARAVGALAEREFARIAGLPR